MTGFFLSAASRMIEMSKKRLDVDWTREIGNEDLNPALKPYSRYLEDIGLRESTISSYVFRVGEFLEFARNGYESPQEEDFAKFSEMLHDIKLSRSSIQLDLQLEAAGSSQLDRISVF